MAAQLKHARALLWDISNALHKLPYHTSLDCVRVTFIVDEEHGTVQRYEFSLRGALSALADDLYWDERGNWSEAKRAEVDTF